jgi:hypothetical protein
MTRTFVLSQAFIVLLLSGCANLTLRAETNPFWDEMAFVFLKGDRYMLLVSSSCDSADEHATSQPGDDLFETVEQVWPRGTHPLDSLCADLSNQVDDDDFVIIIPLEETAPERLASIKRVAEQIGGLVAVADGLSSAVNCKSEADAELFKKQLQPCPF